MQEVSILSFHNYRLEPARARLWRGKQAVKLPPKAFGVLQHLAEHPGQLVTKEELFRVAWPETVVTDSTLTVCIKELVRRYAITPSPRAISRRSMDGDTALLERFIVQRLKSTLTQLHLRASSVEQRS